MSSYVLYTLREVRVAGERQAEQALAGALAAVHRAEAERDRLAARLREARAGVAAARSAQTPATTAGQAQARERFRARREAEARSAAEAVERHRTGVLEPADRLQEEARAAHVRARQRRELVDKAIARREAAARRERLRRDEAAADDLGRRLKS
jgi:hypothetical protein